MYATSYRRKRSHWDRNRSNAILRRPQNVRPHFTYHECKEYAKANGGPDPDPGPSPVKERVFEHMSVGYGCIVRSWRAWDVGSFIIYSGNFTGSGNQFVLSVLAEGEEPKEMDVARINVTNNRFLVCSWKGNEGMSDWCYGCTIEYLDLQQEITAPVRLSLKAVDVEGIQNLNVGGEMVVFKLA